MKRSSLCVTLCICILISMLLGACASDGPVDNQLSAEPSSTYKDMLIGTNFDPDDITTWYSDTPTFPTAEDIAKIQPGMTLTEVVHILGLPKRDIGSGKIILEWELKAENNLVIVFERESVDTNLSLGDSMKAGKIATDGSIKGIYS